MAEAKIIHLESKQRFEMSTQAGDAYISYRITNKTEFDIDYTFVPEALRGLGHGEALVKAGTDYAVSKGYSVKASCSFAHRTLLMSESGSTHASRPDIAS